MSDDNHDDEWGAAPEAVQGPDSWFTRDEGDGGGLDMPHWTEPGTGEMPLIGGVAPSDEEIDNWSPGGGPRWRGAGDDFDESDDIALLGEDPLAPAGASNDEFFFSFDEPSPDHPSVAPIDEAPAPVALAAPPAPGLESQAAAPAQQSVPHQSAQHQAVPHQSVSPQGAPIDPGHAPRPQPEQEQFGASSGGSDRDIGQAVGVGIALAALVGVALFLGTFATIVLITVLLGLSILEFYNAVRPVGYHPALLVGLAVTVGLPLGIWWRGLVAYPVVLFLGVVFSLLWYLVAPQSSRSVPNLGITMLGIGWVGVLGSFAALLLMSPTNYVNEAGLPVGPVDNGTGLLLAAVVVTVAYDVGAWITGRTFGRSPLASVSPNKTVEGLIGGFVIAIIAAVVGIGLVGVAPWGELPGGISDVIVLGIVGGIAATVGDLCQSMIKRDLRIKDMGTMLPGHGGLLDRFDALLFVLPATWCAAIVLGVANAPV